MIGVRPDEDGGYRVETKPIFSKKKGQVFEADRVIFAGGVMGTLPLLLKMKEDSDEGRNRFGEPICSQGQGRDRHIVH